MLVIDRFEGQWAVVEHGDITFNLPRVLLPIEAKEGDVLRLSLEVDTMARIEREKRIKSLMDELFE